MRRTLTVETAALGEGARQLGESHNSIKGLETSLPDEVLPVYSRYLDAVAGMWRACISVS